MKSRFAVSVLFILIAATFTPDAIGAFAKLRSWTGKLCARYAIQVCNRVISRDSAPTSALKAGDEEKAAMRCLDGGRQPLCENCASGKQPRVVGAISPDGKTIPCNSLDATKILSSHEGCFQGVVFKLAASDRRPGHGFESFEFIRTVARQMHEVLDLMCVQ